MNIEILEMHLQNFKGIKQLSINFKPVTFIFGDNGTGKTTIFDAFTWLLFGKDSSDRKDFNIKTLDKNNKPINKVNHEVAATLIIDNVQHTFKRVFKEKWVKKRGQEETEFSGHETEFYYNDVPLSQNEYKGKIDALINENVAKLITSPTYFNSMKWQDRRNVLTELAGTITDADIASSNEEFTKLINQLTGKSLVEYKREVAAKRKKIKDELETIPTRIDEANRSIPEEQNWDEISAKITQLEKQMDDIENYINDVNTAAEKDSKAALQKQGELHQLKSQLQALEQNQGSEVRLRVSELEGKVRVHQNTINADNAQVKIFKDKIADRTAKIEQLGKENESLRNKWAQVNAEEFTMDESRLCCPTCKTPFEESKKEETITNFRNNFNADKTSRLDKINGTGLSNKNQIELYQKDISDYRKAIEECELRIDDNKKDLAIIQSEIETLSNTPIAANPEIETLKAKIKDFVVPKINKPDVSQYQNQKKEVQAEVNALNAKLSERGQIDRIKKRIDELKADEKKLAQEMAELERTEFVIDSFNKTKIEAIEQRINDKFKVVKWKMFEAQINGGESEICECMVNGVPYSDVNTAGKINAGIDIINALTAHYNVTAPIFIDNRESVNELITCNSQLINLVVSKDKKLLIQ